MLARSRAFEEVVVTGGVQPTTGMTPMPGWATGAAGARPKRMGLVLARRRRL